MRALLFEFMIVLLYLVEGNQEVTWPSSRKNAKKISYKDLTDISMSFENLKDEKVHFESSSSPQFSDHKNFTYTFKKMYAENPKLTLTLNDIIDLVQRDAINETQAIIIWDILVKSKVAPQQPEFKFDILQQFVDLVSSGKNFLGDVPIFLIFLCGYVILLLVYIYLGVTFYVKASFWALAILSAIFLYNFYYLAYIMGSQLQSVVFTAFIYNSLFFIAAVLGHSLLCTAGLQTAIAKWQEIFDANINFEGKTILSIFCTVLGYIFALRCNFFIAHFPFFLSMLYTAYILGKKLTPNFGQVLQPFSLFAMSILGFLLFAYIYIAEKNSFVPSSEIVQAINQLIHVDLLSSDSDLRFAGILVCSTVVLAGFPLYLIVQSLNLGKDYLQGNFSYKNVFEVVKKIQAKTTFSQSSSNKSLWLLAYGILAVFAMYLGFKIHVHFIVILAIFGLQSFNGIYAKERGITNVFFFYTSGLITVNATFLLGQIDDQFSSPIFGEHKTGYFLFILEAIIRMTLNYYAFAICSANITSQDMGKVTSFKDMCTFGLKYLCNYLFAVYLIVMAELEKSALHSLFYSVSAVVSFSKVLLYSSSKNDPSARLLISFSIFASGLRITLLSENLAVPFYFGLLLMNFSVFVTYTTFTHSLSIPIALLYFAGLLSQAVAMKSSFMMMLVIVNMCGLVATRVAESKDKMLKIFLTLVGGNMLLVSLNKFDFQIYYQTVESILNTIIPNFLSRFWSRTLEDRNILEHNLARDLLNEFVKMF